MTVYEVSIEICLRKFDLYLLAWLVDDLWEFLNFYHCEQLHWQLIASRMVLVHMNTKKSHIVYKRFISDPYYWWHFCVATLCWLHIPTRGTESVQFILSSVFQLPLALCVYVKFHGSLGALIFIRAVAFLVLRNMHLTIAVNYMSNIRVMFLILYHYSH